jgi:hypothetical protein
MKRLVLSAAVPFAFLISGALMLWALVPEIGIKLALVIYVLFVGVSGNAALVTWALHRAEELEKTVWEGSDEK